MVLITDKSAQTGVGKYAYLLRTVLGENCEFIMLGQPLTNNHGERGRMENQVPLMKNATPLPSCFPYRFAKFIPNLSFASLREYISKRKKEGGIIHYTSQLLVPLDLTLNNVITIHDLMSSNYHFGSFPSVIPNKLLAIHYSKFKAILVPTNYVRKQVLRINPFSNVSIIPHPVSPTFRKLSNKTELRQKYGIPLHKNVILSVSTNGKNKNVAVISKVLTLLGNNYVLVRLGPMIPGAFNFRNLSEAEVNELYNLSDVLIFPTLDEGQGFPLLEAFATELPVVSSNIEVVREVAGDGSLLYTDPLNPKEIAESTKAIINDPKDFIKKASERVKSFSLDTFTVRMHKFYKEL